MERNEGNLTKQDAVAAVNVIKALTEHPRYTMRTLTALEAAAGGSGVVVQGVLDAFSHDVLRRSSDGETLIRLR